MEGHITKLYQYTLNPAVEVILAAEDRERHRLGAG